MSEGKPEVELDAERANALAAVLPGQFVVFDGGDGCGKTTQFNRLLKFCERAGIEVEEVREPGGTRIGEGVRSILLDPENDMMDLRAEMLLYMASRAQLLAERIEPALAAGRTVLADRFISATLAYQGTAGGLSPEEIMMVGNVVLRDRKPDLVVIFDLDEASAAERRGRGRGAENEDRIEQKGLAFQRRVREGYLAQVRGNPKTHALIDSSADSDKVFSSLLQTLCDRLA